MVKNGQPSTSVSFRRDEHRSRRDECLDCLLLSTDRKLASEWKPVNAVPDDVRAIDYEKDLTDPNKKKEFDVKRLDDHVSQHVTFIVNEKKKLVYPELKIQQNIYAGSKSSTSGHKSSSKRIFSELDLQTWYYDKVSPSDLSREKH